GIEGDLSRAPTELPVSVRLELNSDTIMQMAISLSCAIERAEADIADQQADAKSKGFAPGTAFRDWLFAMRNWARDRHLPFGGFADDREAPAPFAEFLFELNEMFAGVQTSKEDGQPAGSVMRESVKSAKAMAYRLKDVAGMANRLEREGAG